MKTGSGSRKILKPDPDPGKNSGSGSGCRSKTLPIGMSYHMLQLHVQKGYFRIVFSSELVAITYNYRPHLITSSKAERIRLKNLISELESQAPVEALGLFNVDMHTLASLISTAFTYLIIMVQFNEPFRIVDNDAAGITIATSSLTATTTSATTTAATS